MNYKKHYDLLINRAINRTIDGYTENHHIIPRCMGGIDEKSNLVSLTAKEHYVAHQLLVKIYPKEYKLLYALNRMSDYGRYSGKAYQWIKVSFYEYQKMSYEEKFGDEKAQEIKQKLSNFFKGKVPIGFENYLFKIGDIPWNKGIPCSDETKQKISDNRSGIPAWNKGIESKFNGMTYEEIHGVEKAQEIKEKISITSTGRTHTEETKEKLRQYKGENNHNFGKKREEGHSEKVSDGLKLYWAKVKSGEIIRVPRERKKTGKPAWNRGITGVFHHSEETKQKISIKMKEYGEIV